MAATSSTVAAQVLERQRLVGLVAERTVNGGVPAMLDELAVHAQELAVLVGLEQRPAQPVRAREVRLALDRPDADQPVVAPSTSSVV